MTTFIGSKRLQRNKVPEVNRFHQKQKKGVLASLLPTLDEMRHWIPAFLQ